MKYNLVCYLLFQFLQLILIIIDWTVFFSYKLEIKKNINPTIAWFKIDEIGSCF